MHYNSNIHHRRSIRLKGYDYSQAGLYFVTICVNNRQHLFGNIDNGKIILNDAGKMTEKWCEKLPIKFTDITLGEYIINNPKTWNKDRFNFKIDRKQE
ncbi:MAG: hypothetical protein FWC94_00795 [Bacteroidales bacterium]|nr:hypothetical protein [Bacteroidales bacterium]